MTTALDRLERKLKRLGNLYPLSSDQSVEQDYLQQLNKEIGHYETRLRMSGEEVPPPKKEKNVLLTALDYLDRPRNAVANAIQNVVDNEGSFIQGLIDGFSGKEKVYGGEYIERAGVKNPIARAVLGFALDVAMDPLTYTGIKPAKEIARRVGMAVGSTAVKEGLSSLGQYLRVTPAGQKIADAIGPKFSNRYVRYSTTSGPEERKELRELIEDIHRSTREIYGHQVSAAEEIWKQFKDIPEEARKLASHAVEEPIRSAERIIKEGPQALEEHLRGIYGNTLDEALAPLEERYAREMASKVKGGPGKKAFKGDIEEILVHLGEKKYNRITDAARKKALKQLARASGALDVVGAENIAKKAAEAGVSVEDVEKAAQLAKKTFTRSAYEDIAAGLEFTPIPNYVRHLYPKDDPKKVEQALTEWRSAQAVKRARMTKKGGFQYERTIPTIEEAKKLGLHPIEDVAVLTAVREMEGIRSRLTKQLFNKLGEIGKPFVMTAAEHRKALSDAAEAGDRETVRRLMEWKQVPSTHFPQNKLVHPEVGQALERAMDVFVTTGGAKELLNAWNKVQNIWKATVTSIVPTFHIRNMFGNFFNNYLAGVTNPAHYAAAIRILEGSDAPFRLGDKVMTGQQIYREFIDQGLVGFGFFRGESKSGMLDIMEDVMRGWNKPRGLVSGLGSLPSEIKKTAKESRSAATKALSPITGTTKFAFKYGRAVGDFAETWAKLAHYISKRAKGLSPLEASTSVRKYLFDYGDITPLEKTLRTFVPFYTFTRKNVPLQMETLIKDPAKMAKVVHLLDEAREASGIDDTPEWIKEDLAIPIGTDDKGYQQYLRVDFPMSQLAFLGTGGHKELLNMLSPLIRVPFEVATGRKVSGGEISPYEGARGRYYLPFLPGQKPGEPYQLPAEVDYAIQQTGGVGREIMEILTSLAGMSAGNAGEEPSLARRISDVMITREESPPPEARGKVPPTVRQLPFVGSFWYRNDPRRQAMLDAIRRRRQLQEHIRYLRDVEGKEVPTLRELGAI